MAKKDNSSDENTELFQYHTSILNEIDFFLRAKIWKIKKILGFKSTKTIPMWPQIAIELHSNCNRDCFFCPRYNDRTGVRKDKDGKHVRKKMPTEKVKDIIDQAAELGYKGYINFHRLSEPFLDERYVDIAKYAKSKGMKVIEDTNGDILKNDEELCKKLDGLLTWIKIGLYDYKTEEEKKQQMEFWKKRFKKTKVAFSLAAEYPRIRIGSKLYSTNVVSDKVRERPCFATDVFLIRYDGEVCICCQDDQAVFNFGNVFDKKIKDIWWSKKHIEVVNNLKEKGKRKLYPLCKECTNPY